MADKFSFVPHVQSRLADLAEPPASGESRLSLAFDLQITEGASNVGSRVPLGATLRGPGDIASLDPTAILRTEPRAGLRGFEPNYFPMIEFRDADLPWRYSLDTGTGDRKDPWLTLIVLQADEFSVVDTSRSVLKRISVRDAAVSLPDPDTLWASAHVQNNLSAAATGSAEANATDALNEAPEHRLSRLMCLRRLEPTRSYYAFVVPVYEAGRLAGLGERGNASPYDAYAWSRNPGPVDLPVYHDWRFTTDEAEDLELLLRRLKGLDENALEQVIGDTRVSAQSPGYYGKTFPRATFRQASAMQLPSQSLGPVQTDRELTPLLIETLTTTIEQGDKDEDEDPLVTFPAYGMRFKPESGISATQAQRNRWFDRINLDLPLRHAAGLGAAVVQTHQETFAHQAWAQYEEIVAANELLARLQVAEYLADTLNRRHFARLSDQVALTLAEPLGDAARVDGDTVKAKLQKSGVPLSSVTRTLRRVAAKRARSSTSSPGDSVPMPGLPGATPRVVTPRPRALAGLGDGVITSHGALKGVDERFLKLFGQTVLARTPRPKAPVVAVGPVALDELVKPLQQMLSGLPRAKALVRVPGRSREEQRKTRPVWRAPSIPAPMAAQLRELNRESLFAGADDLPDNTIVVLEESRPFVEAFLVGMNHEMNRELRWREFPTDMRGTIFKRFWDRGYPASDTRGDDIGEIHTWEKTLGNNRPADTPNTGDNLIVLMRGDIVRKLGDAILAINIAEDNAGFEADKGVDHAPTFMGRLGRDTLYFGFDMTREQILAPALRDRAFFVIYEPAGQMRFGLDMGSLATRRQRRKERRIAHGFDLATTKDLVYRPKRAYEGQPRPNRRVASPDVPALGAITAWDQLSWVHMDPLSESGYIPVDRDRQTRLSPNHLGSARTSASLARAFWQKPVAGVLPLKGLL